ncbi:hypothetical protein GCM10020331_002860 [Ectobacillus funiculus]
MKGGNLNPSNTVKITWGVIQSLVAVVLLLAGGLQVLQTASITASLPFAIIMVIMCWSFFKELKNEAKEQKNSNPKKKKIS